MASTHKIRERFTSFWSDSAEHDGKAFSIVAMVWCGEEEGMNAEPRFNIVFADGESFADAGAEELFEGWAMPERETSPAKAEG
jgi:hypothetical protein